LRRGRRAAGGRGVLVISIAGDERNTQTHTPILPPSKISAVSAAYDHVTLLLLWGLLGRGDGVLPVRVGNWEFWEGLGGRKEGKKRGKAPKGAV
jgi:hypothetical protein